MGCLDSVLVWAYVICYLYVLPSTVRPSGGVNLTPCMYKLLFICTPDKYSKDVRDVQPARDR